MVGGASPFAKWAMKRPSSALQDGYAGQELISSTNTPVNPFSTPYALIYMDNAGEVKVSESLSTYEEHTTLFTPDICNKFLKMAETKIGYDKPIYPGPSGVGIHICEDSEDPSRQLKKRKASIQNPTLDVHLTDQNSNPVGKRPRCLKTELTYPECLSTETIGLRIGDRGKVLEYYKAAFEHFRQLNCRHIAKAFIKFIEPGKQAEHPYNGMKARVRGSGRTREDPEKTKPQWWPNRVPHRGPDHLGKENRIRLLIHIIRELGNLGITSDNLQEVAHESKRLLKPPFKIKILDEILEVRRMEEQYEAGKIDDTALVYIAYWGSNFVTVSEHNADGKGIMDPKECSLTCSSPAQQTPNLPNPVSPTMGGPKPSMHLDDSNQLHSLPKSLTIEDRPISESTYYSTTSEQLDNYAHGMSESPTISTMVSRNHQTGSFDYWTSAPTIASTIAGQMSSGHFAEMPVVYPMSHSRPWGPPPQDSSTRETLPQPAMYYQVPKSSTPYLPRMPGALPESTDPEETTSSWDP